MDSKKFLENYQQLQYSIMGDILINLKYASVTLNNTDTSSFWNHAFLKRPVDANEFDEIEKVLTKHNRKPALYFGCDLLDKSFKSLLDQQKYKKDWEDC